MQITEKQLQKFQNIYKESFGISINKQKARILATKLLTLYKYVGKQSTNKRDCIGS